jgi:hypothetical protein
MSLGACRLKGQKIPMNYTLIDPPYADTEKNGPPPTFPLIDTAERFPKSYHYPNEAEGVEEALRFTVRRLQEAGLAADLWLDMSGLGVQVYLDGKTSLLMAHGASNVWGFSVGDNDSCDEGEVSMFGWSRLSIEETSVPMLVGAIISHLPTPPCETDLIGHFRRY